MVRPRIPMSDGLSRRVSHISGVDIVAEGEVTRRSTPWVRCDVIALLATGQIHGDS